MSKNHQNNNLAESTQLMNSFNSLLLGDHIETPPVTPIIRHQSTSTEESSDKKQIKHLTEYNKTILADLQQMVKDNDELKYKINLMNERHYNVREELEEANETLSQGYSQLEKEIFFLKKEIKEMKVYFFP
jgi:hypothetical protein